MINNYKNDLEEKGFFVKENFLSDQELKDLNTFFENEFKSNKHRNEKTNQNACKFDNEELFKFDCLNKLTNKMNKFISKELSISVLLRNIRMIESKEHIDKSRAPYACHIDKKRYLKMFIYLNNVTLNDGPFTVAVNSSPKKHEEIRLNWWEENEDDLVGGSHGLKINDDDLQYEAMTLKQGTLICFDTNTPHYAGTVLKGGCRKVLRFNYFSTFNDRFDWSFNKKMLKSKFIGFRNRVLQ